MSNFATNRDTSGNSNCGISYRVIADAIDFYVARGYQLIEVPWIVDLEVDRALGIHPIYEDTNPTGEVKVLPLVQSNLGVHIASGEVGFLQLMVSNPEFYKKGGKYCTVTTCYRDDPLDNIHQKYFVKLELLVMSPNLTDDMNIVINDAVEFFYQYTKVKTVATDNDCFDITTMDDIELGSYGIRTTKVVNSTYRFVYGTGVAEPRFSYCLNQKPRGYHLMNIPKGKLGEASKIFEEVEEFRDAIQQGNPIMQLVELSDLLGAIESYAKKFNMSINDLLTMSNVTKQAFRNGRR